MNSLDAVIFTLKASNSYSSSISSLASIAAENINDSIKNQSFFDLNPEILEKIIDQSQQKSYETLDCIIHGLLNKMKSLNAPLSSPVQSQKPTEKDILERLDNLEKEQEKYKKMEKEIRELKDEIASERKNKVDYHQLMENISEKIQHLENMQELKFNKICLRIEQFEELEGFDDVVNALNEIKEITEAFKNRFEKCLMEDYRGITGIYVNKLN